MLDATPDIASRGPRIDLKTLLILLSVSLVVASVYYSRVAGPGLGLRLRLHDQIVANTAFAPYRYRILVPLIGEVSTRWLSGFLSREQAFLLTFRVLDQAAVFAVLLSLFLWLREWFSREQCLIGVLFVAGTMSVALQDHYYQPWSLPETAFLTAALLAIRRGRYWVVACLVAVAALNRETAVFIPLAFLVVSLDVKSVSGARQTLLMPILQSIGLFAVWALVFFGLRYARGSVGPVETIGGLLAINMTRESLTGTAANWSLFLGVFWVFAVLGFPSAPRFVRRLAWIIPPYLAVIAFWGLWFEVRLLMPLYPVLIALGLSHLYRAHVTNKELVEG